MSNKLLTKDEMSIDINSIIKRVAKKHKLTKEQTKLLKMMTLSWLGIDNKRN
jgi:hypothetical protein